jgi:hypothetical protein
MSMASSFLNAGTFMARSRRCAVDMTSIVVPFSAVCIVGTNSTMWSVTESSHPTSLFHRSLVSGAMGSSLRCSPKADAARFVMALDSASADDTPLPVPDMSSPSSSLANFSFITSSSKFHAWKRREEEMHRRSSSDHILKNERSELQNRNNVCVRAYLTAARRARAGSAAPPPPCRGAAAGCRCHCRCTRSSLPRRLRCRCPCRGSAAAAVLRSGLVEAVPPEEAHHHPAHRLELCARGAGPGRWSCTAAPPQQTPPTNTTTARSAIDNPTMAAS